MTVVIDSLFDFVQITIRGLLDFSERSEDPDDSNLLSDLYWALNTAVGVFLTMWLKSALSDSALERWLITLGLSITTSLRTMLLTAPFLVQLPIGVLFVFLCVPLLHNLWHNTLKIVQAITNRISLYAKKILASRGRRSHLDAKRHNLEPQHVSLGVDNHAQITDVANDNALRGQYDKVISDLTNLLNVAYNNAISEQRGQPHTVGVHIPDDRLSDLVRTVEILKGKLQVVVPAAEQETFKSVIDQLDRIAAAPADAQHQASQSRTVTQKGNTSNRNGRNETETPYTDMEGTLSDRSGLSSPFEC